MNFPTREPWNQGTGVSGTFLFKVNFGKKPVICLPPPYRRKKGNDQTLTTTNFWFSGSEIDQRVFLTKNPL